MDYEKRVVYRWAAEQWTVLSQTRGARVGLRCSPEIKGSLTRMLQWTASRNRQELSYRWVDSTFSTGRY